MMTQLINDYAKGKRKYPPMVQTLQALMTEWERGKIPVHGSNDGLTFTNVVNDDDGNRDATCGGGTHESGGRGARDGAPETRPF